MMRKEIFIVSNNSLIWERYPAMRVEGDLDAVFLRIRDLVHQGHRILTHPLAGSVKPHETEFKSVVLEKSWGALDPDSLALIESAMATAAKFRRPFRDWGAEGERIRKDFQVIDASLLETGLEGLGRTLWRLVPGEFAAPEDSMDI